MHAYAESIYRTGDRKKCLEQTSLLLAIATVNRLHPGIVAVPLIP